MTGPISPKEVAIEKSKHIPDYVFDAFNKLIALNYCNGSAEVNQDDVITEIVCISDPKITRQEIFAKGFLNVESAYEAKGWKVYYDKPGYNESYVATFTFSDI